MEPRIGSLPDQNPLEQQPSRRKLRSHKPDQHAPPSTPTIKPPARQSYAGRLGRSCRSRTRNRYGKPHMRKRASSSSPPDKTTKTRGTKTTKTTARKERGSRRTQQSSSSSQMLTQPVTRPGSGGSTTSGRANRVADPDHELRRREMEEFHKTGDYNAFADFVAPFLKGDGERDLTEWELDTEKGRYWRIDRSTGQVIWAPTMDSFR